MSDVGIGEAGARLEMLVQQCAAGRERVVITGDGGEPAAVLISAEELADLDDRLVLALYELRKARGTVETESHDEVVRAVYAGEYGARPGRRVRHRVEYDRGVKEKIAAYSKEDPRA